MSKQFGPEYVRAIAPYQAGKPISEVAREFGLDEEAIVKLASNENPFGVPESAKEAMAKAAADLGRYPDANAFDLKQALSKRYDVPAEWITYRQALRDKAREQLGTVGSGNHYVDVFADEADRVWVAPPPGPSGTGSGDGSPTAAATGSGPPPRCRDPGPRPSPHSCSGRSK